MESLKSQLENVQRECMRTQKDNTELRALMNAVNREHKDNYQDLENEHTAYITQVSIGWVRCKELVTLLGSWGGC